MATETAPLFTRELMRCATAIAHETPIDVDLTWTKGHTGTGELIFPGKVIEALAYNVERLTGGQSTIRRVDSAVAPVVVQGQALWMVRCPIDTPDELIVYPTDEMSLILLTPNRDGIQLGHTAVSARVIRQRLVARALRQQEWAAQEALLKERDQRVAISREWIAQGIAFFMRIQPTGDVASAFAGAGWRERLGSMRVNELLELCDTLEVDLRMVMQWGAEQYGAK